MNIKFRKSLILFLTAMLGMLIAQGAWAMDAQHAADGLQAWSLPDFSMSTNNSVGILVQMFGPLIQAVLGGKQLDSHAYLFADILAYWNFFISSSAAAFITYHMIMGFVKSAENGKFLGSEGEKVGTVLRYSMGGFMVAPVIAGKFCAMQIFFMTFILVGVNAANKVWRYATYDIQMGVTPTVPSNVTTTINGLAGQAYLYKMVDTYLKAVGTDMGTSSTTTGMKLVDLEDQPSYESVAHALTDRYSYHSMAMQTITIPNKPDPKPDPDPEPTKCSTDSPFLDPYCGMVSIGVCTDTKITNCQSESVWAKEADVSAVREEVFSGNGVCDQNMLKYPANRSDCWEKLDAMQQSGLIKLHQDASATLSSVHGLTSSNQDSLRVQKLNAGGEGYQGIIGGLFWQLMGVGVVPGVSKVDATTQLDIAMRRYQSWNEDSCIGTQVPVPGPVSFSVCEADVDKLEDYANGSWVIAQNGIVFKGDTSTGASQDSTPDVLVDGSNRAIIGSHIKGFERAVLMENGSATGSGNNVSYDSVTGAPTVTAGSVNASGLNAREQALIEPLGFSMMSVPANYNFPILAGAGSLYTNPPRCKPPANASPVAGHRFVSQGCEWKCVKGFHQSSDGKSCQVDVIFYPVTYCSHGTVIGGHCTGTYDHGKQRQGNTGWWCKKGSTGDNFIRGGCGTQVEGNVRTTGTICNTTTHIWGDVCSGTTQHLPSIPGVPAIPSIHFGHGDHSCTYDKGATTPPTKWSSCG